MTLESRELPKGFVWKECSSINAKFPMPQEWFFRAQTVLDTRAIFMTREPIIADSLRALFIGKEMSYQTLNPEGYFKTGLAINVFPDFYKRRRRSPVAEARDLMDKSPKEIMPTSQITRFKDGPLVTLRRFFRSEVPIVMGRKMDPSDYYIEFTGNELTGALYIIMFHTPSEKWQEDAEIARTMIENRVLDKSL